MDSLIPSRKKKPVEQPPQKSKIMKIKIDNSRPIDSPPPQLLPPPTPPTPPPTTTVGVSEEVELADQLEMAAPDVPTDSPLPSTGLMVSHNEGHLLPLQPPVIIDDDDSSDSSDDEEPDFDLATSGELSHLMNKFKERMRQQQLKIERKKLYLADLKKLRKRKLDERRSVKSLLTQLIERQANYENYLKQAFEFITDVRDRQRAARLDIYQSDKIMVELKMKINQVGSKLGLSEGEVIDQKKMIEIERLNKKKNELAEKLATMANMIKQYNKDESPVATPPPPLLKSPPAIELAEAVTKLTTFEELTVLSLPKLNIKLKVTEQAKPVISRYRQKREAIAVTRLSSAYKSPLVIFRSYRMSPNFRQQELDVSSATYSHKLNPNLDFCAYNLSGKCNNSRCTSQHWRDIVLTPDELFLDLLSYHGELIKLTSFAAYADKLKAAAAYVNRVLPAELNLKLSQKCMVLVDQINAETKIKSHHVSTYAPIERHGLQHNKRKAGGVIVEQDVASKRLRLDSCPRLPSMREENEEDMRYFYDENENELGDTSDNNALLPSLQAIKDLEEVTLAEPHNINAWSELAKRLISSRLPKRNELGLACLSEALDQNPKCARLWSQYLRLFYKSQSAEQQNDEFDRVIAFCDDHVELDTGFWQLRLDLTRNIVDKGQILEKYISRLLEVADEEEKEKSFEVELTNAILFRTHLLHLESGLDEASATIIGFTAVYNFANVSRLVLWLSWLTLRLTGQLPDCFTTVNIDLRQPLVLKSPLAMFDPAVYPFFERLSDDESQFELDPSDYESLTVAVDEIIDNWGNEDHSDSELLLLQIVEIIHKSKNAGDFASSCADKMRMASFYALAIYLQSESLQIDDNATHAPSVSFVLSYQAAEQANDRASAAGFLESTISRYYKGDSINSEHLVHLYRRLLQVTLSEKEPLLNVIDSMTLPELSSVTMVLGVDNLWLWCCYLLAQSIQNETENDDDNSMVPYFELVLRAISNIKMATSKPMDARPVWLFYIKWCSLHRPSDTSQLIQRFISQDPSSTSANHLIELYFGTDQALHSGSEMLNNIWNVVLLLVTILAPLNQNRTRHKVQYQRQPMCCPYAPRFTMTTSSMRAPLPHCVH